LWLLLFLLGCESVVLIENGTKLVIDHHTGNIGPSAGSYEVRGSLMVSDPLNGCNPLPSNCCNDTIMVMIRGNCTFSEKVSIAQSAGAVGVIISNDDRSEDQFVIMARATGDVIDYDIPAVFVLHSVLDQLVSFKGEVVLDDEGEIKTGYSAVRVFAIVLMMLPSFWCIIAIVYVVKIACGDVFGRWRRSRCLVHIPATEFSAEMITNRQHPFYLHNSVCSLLFRLFTGMLYLLN